MNNTFLGQTHPLGKALVFLGLIIVGIVIGLSISMGLIGALGVEVESKIGLQIQTFFGSQIGGFLLPVVFFLLLFGKESVNGFYLKRPRLTFILLTILLGITAVGVVSSLGELNVSLLEGHEGIAAMLKEFEDKAAEITLKMLEMETFSALMLNIFLVAVVPAVCEELAFRGVIQGQLAKTFKNEHVAIWFTAAIFSAIHFQFFGFLPRMVLGAIFGYLLVYTGNIWMPILAHFINNTLGVIGYYIAMNTDYFTIEEVENTEVSWYTALISAVIVLGIVLFMKSNGPWLRIRKEYFNFDRPSSAGTLEN